MEFEINEEINFQNCQVAKMLHQTFRDENMPAGQMADIFGMALCFSLTCSGLDEETVRYYEANQIRNIKKIMHLFREGGGFDPCHQKNFPNMKTKRRSKN